MRVERARINDAPQIQRLVNFYADKGEMLHRPLSEIYENLRDYFVVRNGEEVLACVAFHLYWSDLAEIRALVVKEESQAQGLGTQLVEACIEEARNFGIPVIFALTYTPPFFKRFGFWLEKRERLPRKVWGECLRCPKFPDCDEKAVVLSLEPVGWLRWRKVKGKGLD